ACATIWSVVCTASGRLIFGTASMASTVSKSFIPIGKLRSLSSCSRSAASAAQSVPCIVSVCSMPVPVLSLVCPSSSIVPRRGIRRPDRCPRKKTGGVGHARAAGFNQDLGIFSVHVVLGVVDVELAGRGDQPLVLDHRLELARLVIDHHDRRFLVLRAPDREPDFIARLVVLGLGDALGA